MNLYVFITLWHSLKNTLVRPETCECGVVGDGIPSDSDITILGAVSDISLRGGINVWIEKCTVLILG